MLSVTTNTAALTAQRNLSSNSAAASGSISKMSSGSRIVKPSDDAASLAISNKLNASIVALEQAGRNASQGSSLLQVANGAYDNIGNMLARMKVLATQVINGTLGTAERLYAQEEFSNLRGQITNTAEQTRFGSVSLLSGGGGNYLNTGVYAPTTGTAAVSDRTEATASAVAGVSDYVTGATVEAGTQTGFVSGKVGGIDVSITGQAFTVSIAVGNQTFVGRIDSTNDATGEDVVLTSTANSANSISFQIGATAVAATFTEAVRTSVEDSLKIALAGAVYTPQNAAPATEDNGFTAQGGTVGVTQNGTTVPVVAGAGTAAGTYRFQYVSTGNQSVTGATGFVNAAGTDDRRGTGFFELTDGANTWTVDQKDMQITGTEGSAGAVGTVTFGNGLQVYLDLAATAANAFDRGDSSTATHVVEIAAGAGVSLNFQVSDNAADQATISFGGATASALGLDGVSIADDASAAVASAKIDSAINTVNTAQATIGALQSRFEYIQSTIATTVENVTAAKGSFKDVDMAAEMTAFTKAQTLMQASVSMLSQANQLPQQLLKLMQ